MKFLFVDDNSYIIFISKIVLNVNLEKKSELQDLLKRVIKILHLKYYICVFGLFEVNIFVNDNIGMFIEIERISSIISHKDTDLKINIIYNCEFYFKTEYYECLNCFENIYFDGDYYYVNAKKLDDIDNYVEYGEFICSNKLNMERDFIRIK